MKALRGFFLALLVSLLVGFAIGTLLRLRMERPVVYMGSAPGGHPFHVVDASATVLHPGQHEEQIG
jgi:hypothetical protein